MSFEKFTEDVLKEIRMKMGDVFQVKKQDVTKNNNVKLTGIAVVKEKEDIEPCIYLDDFYREYESGGMQFDEIVDEVYSRLLKYEEDTPDFDISGFRKWETVHGDIYPKLVNAKQNKELLEKIPHRSFMDLAVVYYVVARDQTQEDIGTILIHNDHMEIWGQEEENLYQTAMMNMRAAGEADFVKIETFVERIMGISFPKKEGSASHDVDMYILTNHRRRFGAAEILDKKMLRMIADQVGNEFIVLPSTVHETIVLPSKEESEYGRLAHMVRAVNDTLVEAEERLSDHVYVYNREEEMLKIAA